MGSSPDRKKAIKNTNAFLYSETDLRVLTKFLKESLSTLCDELTTDSTQSLNVQRYHQNIVLCELCFTAHQKFQVPKRELFKPNYHYRAALTKDVLDGMEELVNSSSNFINFNDESNVLDVGCNDGSLLNIFKSSYLFSNH